MEDNLEHFCTLFDVAYALQGVALYHSLKLHMPNSSLWILCMDDAAYDYLQTLRLPDMHLIALHEIEDHRLLAIKGSRSKGEYCWTLTPFLPSFVLKKDPAIPRATYVDADLFFFDNPNILIGELLHSGKHVLITDHAYDPAYDQTQLSGRFCVQFLTFDQSKESHEVLDWWQHRCLEWCYARAEDGKFGDQKYLDVWPELFAGAIHIVQSTNKTLAPWNVEMFQTKSDGRLEPVFYHFHNFRVVSESKARQHSGYYISRDVRKKIYQPYADTLKRVKEEFSVNHLRIVPHRINKEKLFLLKDLRRRCKGTVSYAEL